MLKILYRYFSVYYISIDIFIFFFFSSRRRHTRWNCDWSSDVCSSDLDAGGILEHLLREVEVECLPTDIPSKLEVDVSALQIGDTLHVSDIKVERAEILTEADRAIAAVVPPTVLEEVKPAEEAAAAEPEVIAKEKKEEGETEEAGKEGGKQAGKEGGKQGGKEGGKQGGKEGGKQG